MHRITEDDALQVLEQLRFRFAGQRGHILHIHFCLFAYRQGEGFRGGIHTGDGGVLLDGALGEKVRLALHLSLVHHFQRAKQIIGIVRRKSQGVAPAVEDVIFLRVGVVKLVQLLLFHIDGKGVAVPHLQVDETLHTVPQLNHALDALLCGGVQIRLDHDSR